MDVDLRVGTSDDGRDGLHRVVDPSVLRGSESVTRRRHGLPTGLSVVIAGGPSGAELVDAVLQWAPREFRVELVLGDPSPTLTDRLDVLAWQWTAVESAAGRASLLDAATVVSTGEFVVVAGPAAGSLGDLEEGLGLMWVNGADALVLAAGDADAAGHAVTTDDCGAAGQDDDGVDRRAGRLSSALGLSRGGARGSVVLRRWVARFLFDGIGRAIDPVSELGDRIRLLELRLLEVAPGG